MPTDLRNPDPSFVSLLTVCCLVTFGCYLAVSLRLPVVPLYARGFGVTTAQIGAINAAFYLMAGLLSIPSGALSDLFGRKKLCIAGSAILCVGMLLLAFGRSYLQLAGVYLLLGGGIAAFGPTMMSWVAEITPPTHLGRAYGWYTTALFCGMGLGPAFGGAAGKFFGYAPVFWIGAAMTAFNLWALHRFLPETACKPESYSERGRWTKNLAAVLSNRPLVGCWAATFGACLLAGMFFSFMPLHADERGLDIGAIGIVFLVQAASNALFRIPFGAFSDRVGKRHRQALGGIVLITLATCSFATAESFFGFAAAALALGVSNAVAFTAVGALIAETTETRYRGLAMGGYNTCIYFGLMAGSIGLGPVIEAMGFSAGFLITAALNLPFVAVFAWSMGEKIQRTEDR
jgi:MFS family permease